MRSVSLGPGRRLPRRADPRTRWVTPGRAPVACAAPATTYSAAMVNGASLENPDSADLASMTRASRRTVTAAMTIPGCDTRSEASATMATMTTASVNHACQDTRCASRSQHNLHRLPGGEELVSAHRVLERQPVGDDRCGVGGPRRDQRHGLVPPANDVGGAAELEVDPLHEGEVERELHLGLRV